MADVIKCDIYDHFEIACMRRSKVSLELHTGETITGVARDLQTRDGKEYLLLLNDEVETQVNLKEIDFMVIGETSQRIQIS